jgi:hypothetical protein
MQDTSGKASLFLTCLFLGFLGLHRFRVGSWFIGTIYLFSLGLLGFGIIIDLILILLNSPTFFPKIEPEKSKPNINDIIAQLDTMKVNGLLTPTKLDLLVASLPPETQANLKTEYF